MHRPQHKSEETLAYSNRYIPQPANCVGNRSYILKQCKLITPNREQSIAIDYIGNIDIYYRLLLHGILYHSVKYREDFNGKRDASR